jgi:hypothetical protein
VLIIVQPDSIRMTVVQGFSQPPKYSLTRTPHRLRGSARSKGLLLLPVRSLVPAAASSIHARHSHLPLITQLQKAPGSPISQPLAPLPASKRASAASSSSTSGELRFGDIVAFVRNVGGTSAGGGRGGSGGEGSAPRSSVLGLVREADGKRNVWVLEAKVRVWANSARGWV